MIYKSLYYNLCLNNIVIHNNLKVFKIFDYNIKKNIF